MIARRFGVVLIAVLIIGVLAACGDSEGASSETKDTVKVGVLISATGALETYGGMTERGFKLGMEYATDGTMEVAGKKIEYIFEDTETDPTIARQKALKLLEDDEVDFLVGSSSSGDTLAVTPLAEEYEKIMIVEPAAADSITGSEYNDYVFRTARNSSQLPMPLQWATC